MIERSYEKRKQWTNELTTTATKELTIEQKTANYRQKNEQNEQKNKQTNRQTRKQLNLKACDKTMVTLSRSSLIF